MKKLSLLLFVAFCGVAQAQLIDRNDIIIHAGVGLGIYRYQFTDVSSGVSNPRDTSVAGVFPIQVEYGINRWLGGGVCFTYHNFIEGDSVDDEQARVADFGVAANFHVPWNLQKFDLTASIGYGYSRFKYTIADFNDWEAVANGTVFSMGINPRIYFSDKQHLGISFWYRYSKHNFPKGEVTDNAGFVYKFKLDGPSNSFGMGFFYKI